MRVNNNKTTIAFLFLLCPIAALPLIFCEIYNKRYYALGYLSVFMALLAYLWTPSGDIYRYHLDFDIIQSLSFAQLIDSFQFDFVIQTLMWLFAKTGLNFEWFRLFTCLFCYTLVFSVLKKIVQNSEYDSNNRKVAFMIFFCFFGLLRVNIFLTGARFTFAAAFLIYSIYYLFYESKTRGWVALAITGITHFSFVPVVLLTLASKVFKPKIRKRTFVVLCIAAYAVSTFLLIAFMDYLNLGDALMDHLENYTTGYYAHDELENHTFLFRIAQIISILAFYVFWGLSVFRLENFSKYRLFAFIAIFCVLLWHMNTAYNRYAGISIFSMLPLFLLNPGGSFKYKDLKLVFFLAIFVFSASIYNVKRELAHGSQYLIATPVPIILHHTYTQQWIDKNITTRGDFEN